MNGESLILLAIFVPVLGAFLLPVFGKISENLRNIMAVLMILTSMLCSFALVGKVISG